MVLVLTGVIFSYCILVICLIIGWHHSVKKQENEQRESVSLSVIVPFRNEVKNILLLLDDLRFQHLAPLEVLLINDHSDDGSREAVERYLADQQDLRSAHWQLIDTVEPGKKQALITGIRMAKGSIMVTTDADCRVGKDWLKSVYAKFVSDKIKLLIGSVRIYQQGLSFWGKVQSMEFASLIGVGASTATLGHPTMCNGANLAFRKTVFQEVGGYEGNLHVPSGDDEFLMRKIVKYYPDGVAFNNDATSVVTTKAAGSVSEFIQQRLRWAAKWKYNSSSITKGLALYILMVQCSILLSFFTFKPLLIVVLTLRALAEYFFLRQVMRFLQVPWSMWSFLFLQIAYPVYALGIALSSNLFPYRWKGRKIAH